jgi:uncharacterized protein
MRLPEKKNRINEALAKSQIYHAIDQGVNYLDTAMPYHMGASETFLGKILKEGVRDKINLATKLPPWSVKTRDDMDKILNTQLKKLQTDHIDYYLIHALDRNNWDKVLPLGVLDFLDNAKKEGKIKYAGFSFHGDKDVFKEIVDAYDWEFCQIQYNYLDEQNQAGKAGLKYAAKKDLGIIIMEPLRGGNLGRRIPPDVQRIFDQAPTKRTPAEWALRWVWDHPEVTAVLSGMNRDDHIEENLRIAKDALPDSLTDEERKTIIQVKKTFRSVMKAGCTGCRYCMPCPSGVDIPACFEVLNNLSMFKDTRNSKIMYIARTGGVTTGGPSYASLCENCGECEKACPQHLPIQDLLVETTDTFERKWFKSIIRVARIFIAVQGWLAKRKGKK